MGEWEKTLGFLPVNMHYDLFDLLRIPNTKLIKLPNDKHDIDTASDDIDHGGAAILFLDDSGYINLLEIYANGSSFSETVNTFELKAW